MSGIDPVALSKDLIAAPSVTPADAGALDTLESALRGIGFSCQRMPFEEVDNLFAKIGDGAPHFCFAGHTDVVPPGDENEWSSPPFTPTLDGEYLRGRGAADMKCAIAAFVGAVSKFIQAGKPGGSISILITGDEEGPAINGTRKMLEQLQRDQVEIDHCLVGEPSNPKEIGDMIKVGRRGSINCWLTVTGQQGHVAYPDRAKNPIPALLRKLLALSETPLDDGYQNFQPSSLQITDIHVGNRAHNIIPQEAEARFNIRFNPTWTGETIDAWLRKRLDMIAVEVGAQYALRTIVSGEAFLTTDKQFIDLLADCIEEKTGRRPELSTSGGTSDARFIKDMAPVAEFGMVGATMHKIDEQVRVSDIGLLSEIYEGILARYFIQYGQNS
ncbi:MAG: succinyl-diaminopimelate desuccinylase [Marinicaulis sp.]|nr:succinyl-diaminopimelate desuccinylase [Marinicaulis sp.]NNL90456.1 succinyl-diaminopimelate desuccinylase [Marinicaulis sp.]